MQKATVKIGEWIEEGFNLYKNNFGTLVLTAIIALVLTAITIGILAGPMLAGLVMITLRLLRKEHPEPDPGKVFRGFDYFLNAFLFLLVWGTAIFVGSLILQVFPGVGQLLSLFFVYAAQAFLMFGIFLAVFWPVDCGQYHRQPRRHSPGNRYCLNHPHPGLHSDSGVSGYLQRSGTATYT